MHMHQHGKKCEKAEPWEFSPKFSYLFSLVIRHSSLIFNEAGPVVMGHGSALVHCSHLLSCHFDSHFCHFCIVSVLGHALVKSHTPTIT
uniref:Uncharacterized protein n=1 Tax=Arundo donax TaxID=35708 RepID=A0A0A8Z280_ARUDO